MSPLRAPGRCHGRGVPGVSTRPRERVWDFNLSCLFTVSPIDRIPAPRARLCECPPLPDPWSMQAPGSQPPDPPLWLHTSLSIAMRSLLVTVLPAADLSGPAGRAVLSAQSRRSPCVSSGPGRVCPPALRPCPWSLPPSLCPPGPGLPARFLPLATRSLCDPAPPAPHSAVLSPTPKRARLGLRSLPCPCGWPSSTL